MKKVTLLWVVLVGAAVFWLNACSCDETETAVLTPEPMIVTGDWPGWQNVDEQGNPKEKPKCGDVGVICGSGSTSTADAGAGEVGANELDFGEVLVGQVKEKTYQIYNSGSKDLVLTCSGCGITIPDNPDTAYTILEAPEKVARSQFGKFTIRFQPLEEKSYPGKMQLTYEAHNEQVSLDVALKGKGVNSDLQICSNNTIDKPGEELCHQQAECSELKLDFGKVDLNTQSEVKKVTIRNDGEFPLSLTSVKIYEKQRGESGSSTDTSTPTASVRLKEETGSEGEGEGEGEGETTTGGDDTVGTVDANCPAYDMTQYSAGNNFKIIASSNPGFAVNSAQNGLIDDLPELKAGEGFEISVVFEPKAGGTHEGFIEVKSTDQASGLIRVLLTGQSDAPAICLDTQEIDFGSVAIGTTAEQKLKVCSCGTKTLEISNIGLTSESSADMGIKENPSTVSLEPGDCVEITVTYTPSDRGTDMGGVSIDSNDPTRQHGIVPIYGEGKLPPQCLLDIQPPQVNFGTVPANQPGVYGEAQVMLVNMGDDLCNVTDITDPTNTDFVIINKPTLPKELKPADTILLKLEFHPTKLGTIDGKLTVVEDTKSSDVILLGMGGELGQCQLRMNPAPRGAFGGTAQPALLSFGNVAVGKTKIMPVEFTNIGGNICSVSKAYFGPKTITDFGWVRTPTPPEKIQIGQTVEYGVFYRPASTGPAGGGGLMGGTCMPGFPCGNSDQWVFFKTDATNEPGPYTASASPFGGSTSFPNETGWVVQMDGTGTTSQIAWLPKEVDFGLVTIGCNSQDITVTVYNNGAAPFSVLDAKTETNPPFKIVRTNPTLPQGGKVDVAGGGSMQIVLRYSPTEPPKVEEGKLIITTDASNIPGGTVEVPLTGEGTYESGTVDEFKQFTDIKVDVLWTVDNSGSMSEEQSGIASNYDEFLKYATSLSVDYHIGVVSTEINEANESGAKKGIIPGYLYGAPGYPKIITPQTPNGNAAAAANIQLGTCCSDEQEAGLESARMALDEPLISDTSANAGFFREDARLVLIFLSDEEDQSPGGLPYYVDFFRSKHGARNYDLLSLSIICGLDGNPPKPSQCTSSDGDAVAGERYYEVYSQINNGLALSICDGNYGSMLNKLGLDTFVSRVQYPLSRPADPSTIKVLVNNTPVQQDTGGSGFGWTYDEASNSIVFGESSIPPRGATIKVSYEAICL